MILIPDDPVLRCIERTGYPPWIRDEWEEEEDEEDQDDEEEEDDDERDVL